MKKKNTLILNATSTPPKRVHHRSVRDREHSTPHEVELVIDTAKKLGRYDHLWPPITDPHPEDQEISAMCKTLLQNIIILWNYVELTKIIMRSDKEAQRVLLENITSASILTWQHVNMHGTYDFSNLVAANSNQYSIDEVIYFKVA